MSVTPCVLRVAAVVTMMKNEIRLEKPMPRYVSILMRRIWIGASPGLSISRWARGNRAWSTSDGLIRVAPAVRAAIDAQRLHRRPYSLSALQRYATCPYQYFMRYTLRVTPVDDPETIERMDHLERGSLVHSILERFLKQLGRDDIFSHLVLYET